LIKIPVCLGKNVRKPQGGFFDSQCMTFVVAFVHYVLQSTAKSV